MAASHVLLSGVIWRYGKLLFAPVDVAVVKREMRNLSILREEEGVIHVLHHRCNLDFNSRTQQKYRVEGLKLSIHKLLFVNDVLHGCARKWKRETKSLQTVSSAPFQIGGGREERKRWGKRER